MRKLLERWPDWDVRLQHYLEFCRDEVFAWGVHDCASFAIDAIEVMTGKRVFPAHSWKTKEDAEATLGELGGIERAITRCAEAFGMQEKDVMRANRGDLCIAPLGRAGEIGAGIVGLDGQFILSAAPRGIAAVPLATALRVFEV